MEPTTRRSLVLRLRDPRDEAAWTEFVDIYEPLIYRLARKKGLQDADARDLGQEVLRAVASAIERWDPDPAKGRFRAWLFRIARNLLVNFLASQRRHARGSGSTSVQAMLEAQPAGDAEAEAEFSVEFQRRAFRWAAEQVQSEFTDSTWQAFWKTGVENRPIALVAEELGLSVGAVYIARSRVLARLRECVQHLTKILGGTWEAAMRLRPEMCDSHRLDEFLHSHLPEEFERELEAHLLICPACRNKLDELAGGDRWWKEVRRHLGGDGAAEPLPTSEPAVPPRTPNVDLSFLQPSDDPAALGRLGPYEVLEVVGQGGMGVVLKAFDAALHRLVAIKVLAAEYAANGTARKRFAREAQAAAAVIHDHVVPVHGVDAQATPPYLVMAYIPGQSLQQRIDRSGPLDLKEIFRIGMQTASGLAAAHAQGLVHRDIKPANIMLENGIERVRITDFGLARAVDDATLAQSGTVAGTPQYMAPEQAEGETVDQRADLFALGSTLYAMGTGRAPFRGSSGLAIIRQVCDVEPTPIEAINPDVPVWLAGIIRKLHAKEPEKRFQSAAEVADLLEQCLAHVQQPRRHPLPRLAEELGRQVPGSRPLRRYRRWWPAAAALMLSILCGAIVSLVPRPQEQQLAAPQYDGLMSFDDLRERSDQVRARLEGLRQSLAAPSPTEGIDLEPALDNVRQRAEMLGRNVNIPAEPSGDPVEMELENIRRRLELLQQQIGNRPE